MAALIAENWILLLPLFGLSTVSVGIILERSFYFFSIRARRKDVFDQSMILIRKGEWNAFLQFVRNESAPELVLMCFAIRSAQRSGYETIGEKVEGLALQLRIKMEGRIVSLAGIANIATLLGLFGTVTGMIVAFLQMQAAGVSDPYVLAGGIAQALVTTAFGLGVAIPSLLFYEFFARQVERHSAKTEIFIHEIQAWRGRART